MCAVASGNGGNGGNGGEGCEGPYPMISEHGPGLLRDPRRRRRDIWVSASGQRAPVVCATTCVGVIDSGLGTTHAARTGQSS